MYNFITDPLSIPIPPDAEPTVKMYRMSETIERIKIQVISYCARLICKEFDEK